MTDDTLRQRIRAILADVFNDGREDGRDYGSNEPSMELAERVELINAATDAVLEEITQPDEEEAPDL